MEHKVRVVEPEELMDQLPELLALTEAVPLVISGSSMAPFLIHGRDTVFLSKIDRPLKRGDIVLFRRVSGAYVLHRICRVRKDVYDLVGDGQRVVERGIRREQLLAVVHTVRRDGRLLRKGDPCWMFYEKIWLALLPLRPLIGCVYSHMRAWRRDK